MVVTVCRLSLSRESLPSHFSHIRRKCGKKFGSSLTIVKTKSAVACPKQSAWFLSGQHFALLLFCLVPYDEIDFSIFFCESAELGTSGIFSFVQYEKMIFVDFSSEETYCCTSPLEKAHSQPNELDEKCKKPFLIVKK